MAGSSKNEAARRWQAQGGGGRNGRGRDNSYPQYSTDRPQKQEHQAPSGALPPYYKDGMISIAGRHVCRVRGDALRRTFDATRETFKGGLAFRLDVLHLAAEHGAGRIVATERETGTIYTISLADFKAHGWPYDNREYGRQWTCDFKHWTRGGSEPEPEPTGPTQLSLFGKAGA